VFIYLLSNLLLNSLNTLNKLEYEVQNLILTYCYYIIYQINYIYRDDECLDSWTFSLLLTLVFDEFIRILHFENKLYII
jgi:hypothetical protein